MAARSGTRNTSIPVNVVVQRKPRTVAASTPTPTPRPNKTVQPTSEWSEAHRRRVMWITVGVGSVLIMTIWLSVFSTQIRSTTPTFFGDVSAMIRNVQWPWEPARVTPQEQEIRQLEEQVFPQFQ